MKSQVLLFKTSFTFGKCDRNLTKSHLRRAVEVLMKHVIGYRKGIGSTRIEEQIVVLLDRKNVQLLFFKTCLTLQIRSKFIKPCLRRTIKISILRLKQEINFTQCDEEPCFLKNGWTFSVPTRQKPRLLNSVSVHHRSAIIELFETDHSIEILIQFYVLNNPKHENLNTVLAHTLSNFYSEISMIMLNAARTRNVVRPIESPDAQEIFSEVKNPSVPINLMIIMGDHRHR